MPVTIEVPEHGTVEFPDDMPQEQMEAALRDRFSPRPDEQQVRRDIGTGGFPVPASSEELGARNAAIQQQAFPTQPNLNPTTGLAVIPGAINSVMDAVGTGLTKLANLPLKSVTDQLDSSREAQLGRSLDEPEKAGLQPHVNLVNLPQVKPESVAGSSKPVQLAAGAYNRAAGMASGLTAPGTALTIAAAPAGLARVAFGTQIAANIPGTIQESAKTLRDPNASLMEKGGAIIAPPAEAWMLKQIVKAAPVLPRAAKAAAETIGVTADLESPTPAAPEPAKPASILTPEDQSHIDAERGSVDVPVELAGAGSNEPFATGKTGQIASIDRQRGTIVIDPEQFSAWLNDDMKGLPPERKRMAVRSLLAEERNHLATAPEQATAYHNSLTAAEKLIERKLYTGKFGGRADVSATDLGFEAIRRRMQRLARMDSTETAAAAGAERWGLKSLEVLNDAIRGIRETLGTKASKEGLAILDKVQGNLDAAKAVAAGVAPAALRRKPVEDERQQDFLLPPVKEPVERPGATDLGAKPYETPSYLTPDRVHWEGPRKEGAFRRITDAEANSPEALQDLLTKGWREGGQDRPESVTHNVAALYDRFTGRVDVVSAYKNQREGAMLADPTKLSDDKARPHNSVDSLLWRYTPLYSISLKEPVQNFHERFASIGDFQAKFGNAAAEEASKRTSEAPQGSPAGSGRAAPFQADQFAMPVEIPAVEPPQNAEAGALHDFFKGQIPKTPEAMRTMMTRGAAHASRQMISALRRMMEHEQAKDPNITAEEAVAKSLDNIYDDLTQSKDRAEFTQRTLGRFAEPVAKANEPAGAAGQGQEVPRGTIAEGQITGEANPASLRRVTQPAEDKFTKTLGQVRSAFARHSQKQEISGLVDKAQTETVIASQQAKRNIEQPSSSARQKDGDPKILRGVRAINAAFSPRYRPSTAGPGSAYPSPGRKAMAHADPAELPGFLKQTLEGESKARALLANPTPAGLSAVGLPEITGVTRSDILKIGREWLKTSQDLQNEVRFAAAHFDEPALMQSAVNYRTEINDELAFEHAHGKNTAEVENYYQGIYDGELYGDNAVTFSGKVLGQSYGKPKTFANVYEAIAAGPYIPKINNAAESAAHRIRAGMGSVLKDQAFRAPLTMGDPMTKTPIAIPAEVLPDNKGYQVPGGNHQYELVYPTGGGAPIAVRSGYAKLMEDLFGRSGIERWTGGKGLLKAGALEKHTTLAGDVYHLSKMMEFALAISGRRTGYKGGYSALEFRPEQMAEAVRRGVISKGAMDWAMEPESVTLDGTKQLLTRRQILKEFVKRGYLNVGRVQDAMYKHFVDKLDVEIAGRKWGIGSYNRFLFDEWTRGFMGQTAVEELLRQHRAAPDIDANRIMKRISSDTNTMFGSTGKQGLVKNPTLRDLLQLGFLAAQWTGTRIASEAKFYSRLATTPYVAATKGLPAANVHFGTIGRGVGRGVVTMMVLTQAINLLTRGKFTWNNPEDEHKLDAWVPDTQGGPGHWISPFSVFMEMTHEVSRHMAGGGKNLGETITRIAENKLHPAGRAALTLASGYTPMGQKIPTTGGRFVEAGKSLVPTPITVSAAGRAVGHAVAPSMVSPNPHGALDRQIYASMGVKSEVEKRALQQIHQKAADFMKANGMAKDAGWVQVQTTDPNYTKLRSALENEDNVTARKMIAALRKTHPIVKDKPDPIVRAMKTWSHFPFTGSKAAESAFRASLNDQEYETYAKAQEQRQQLYERFLDLLSQAP